MPFSDSPVSQFSQLNLHHSDYIPAPGPQHGSLKLPCQMNFRCDEQLGKELKATYKWHPETTA